VKRIRILLLLVLLPLYCQCQEKIEWITHFGSSATEYLYETGRKVRTDIDGNIYVAGEFAEAFKFGNIKLSSVGGRDIFIAKLDSNGVIKWIKNFGGKYNDWMGSIWVDANSNIFLTGTFKDQIIVNNSVIKVNGQNNPDPHEYNSFIIKINKDGETIWIRVLSGRNNEITSVIDDDHGYVYIAGHYLGPLKFDNYQILEGPIGRSDLFVIKLDSDGKLIWTTATKSNANNYANAITYDSKGYLYITGFMWDSVYFDHHLLVSTNSLGLMQAFVAKILPSNGNFLWAVGGGGKGWSEGTSIAVNNKSEIVLSGWYRKDLFFNNESLSNNGNDNGPDDTFIAKFNDQGILLWLKKASCNLYSKSNDLTINKNDDIILTGYFRGNILIGDKMYKSTVPSYYDIYVLNLSTVGNLNWFKSFGGDSPMNDIGYGVTSDKNNLFITGMYSSNSWFDNNQINCKGASDIFVLKLSNTTKDMTEYVSEDYVDTTKIIPEEKPESKPGIMLLYPNPCSKILYIQTDNDTSLFQIKILNLSGREIITQKLLKLNVNEINVSNLSPGIYFLQLQNLNSRKILNKKFIKAF
jgi:hypothetical protein